MHSTTRRYREIRTAISVAKVVQQVYKVQQFPEERDAVLVNIHEEVGSNVYDIAMRICHRAEHRARLRASTPAGSPE